MVCNATGDVEFGFDPGSVGAHYIGRRYAQPRGAVLVEEFEGVGYEA